METLQRILVATDFSANAEQAVIRAARLVAGIDSASGSLLHILDLPWLGELRRWLPAGGAEQQKLEAAASERLGALCDRVRREYGVSFAPQVRTGRVAEELDAAALEADLTVVGAWGTHPLRAFALGTTAERFLRRSRRPVLVVKRPALQPYRRILVPVDFSPRTADLRALAHAIAPAGDFTFLHVVAAPDAGEEITTVVQQAVNSARQAATEAWQALVAGAEPTIRGADFMVEQGDPASLIADHARRMPADLIVVGKHGKALREQLLLGSVALNTLGVADCDVLVMADPDA